MEKQITYSPAFAAMIASIFAAEPSAQAILVTNDDQAFHLGNLNYCINHCREHKATYHELTRAHFEKSYPEAITTTEVRATEPAKQQAVLKPLGITLPWRELAFGKLLEYAQRELKLEPLTKSTKGAKVLLAEIDALLAERSLPVSNGVTEERQAGAVSLPNEDNTPDADGADKGSEDSDTHNPVNPS